MRRAVLILLAVLLASGSLTAAENTHQLRSVQDDPGFVGYVPNMFIVQLEERAVPNLNKEAFKSANAFRDVAELDAVAGRFGIRQVDKKFPGMTYDKAVTPQERALTRFFRVHVDEGNIDDAIEAYRRLPMVTQAYKIPIHEVYATPNDPEYLNQWHYYNAYGVDADQAWEIETGDATVVVGILDTGVKYDHGDLGGTNPPGPADNSTNGNIWINDLEVPGNYIDDDTNGYVDDVVGYDFLATSMRCKDVDCDTPDNDPMDAQGHGTHVSGTVSAINNNDYRVAGVAGGYNDGTQSSDANGVQILCCRIGYATSRGGSVNMDAAADAMYYVGALKARGVNVAAINCSWGSSDIGDLAAAADYLISQDVMIVVAAGNDNSSTPRYLNSREDCLSVGGTESDGDVYYWSNYGPWVEVAAPAVGVLSTVAGTGDNTSSYNGTSMAAPHVCGVAALLESYDASLSAQEKWDLICDTANLKPYNMTKDVGDGIVSAKKCLDAIIEECTDPPVADFSGNPLEGDYPLQVGFTDLSTNNPTSWEWDFGDGSAHVYTQHPSHEYTYADTFTVTLTATNDCGYDTEQKVDYVIVTEPSDPPIAAFGANPTSGPIPLEVTFTDSSTQGPTSWTWDFGDGSPVSHDRNPVHTYTSVDTYDVTLTVSNAFGSDDTTIVDCIDAYEAAEDALHVDSIAVWRVTAGPNCDGYCRIYIVDQDDYPVQYADVYVTASGLFNGTGNAETDEDGVVVFHTGMSKNCDGEFCFEVTNVVLAGYTYDSTANNMTKVCESGIVYKGDPFANAGALVPNEYGLSQNYPNPFNPSTGISFAMKESGHATLVVYNIKGQKVATLADGFYNAGVHTVTWHARVSSGVYLYRLQAGDFTETKKMIMLK